MGTSIHVECPYCRKEKMLPIKKFFLEIESNGDGMLSLECLSCERKIYSRTSSKVAKILVILGVRHTSLVPPEGSITEKEIKRFSADFREGNWMEELGLN